MQDHPDIHEDSRSKFPPEEESPVPSPLLVRSRVRVWPATIILALAAVLATFFFVWSDGDFFIRSMAVFFGVTATGVLLLVWWLFGSGLSWKTRLFGLLAMLIGTGIALVGAEERFRMIVGMFSLPFFLIFAVLWLMVAQWWRWEIQKWGIAIIGLLFIALSVSLRLEGGVFGSMLPQVAWRWSMTSEDIAEQYWETHGSGGALSLEDTKELKLTEGDWPEFRGPQRDSEVNNVEIRQDWKENPPQLLWKNPVGLGWSSFAVVGDYVFTQEQRREFETVVCYEADTGEEVWNHRVPARFEETAGGDGPRATPTFYKGRLYVQGATGVLCCLDARTGQEHWATNILEDSGAKNITWGMSGSPLVYDDFVVVHPGLGTEGQSLLAYDRLTGKRMWSSGDYAAAYSSPQLAVLQGVRQILMFHAKGLSGHDPVDGRQLWLFEWPNPNTNNSIQPNVLDDSTVVVSSVFVGTICLNVTKEDDKWQVEQKWKTGRMRLYFNDMVTKDGYAYGIDSGRLVCLDLEEGRRVWKGGQFGAGQILLVGDMLLVQEETGHVSLVEASPNELNLTTRFQAIEGKTWNHPVVAHGRLYVRNSAEAACYDISLPRQRN